MKVENHPLRLMMIMPAFGILKDADWKADGDPVTIMTIATDAIEKMENLVGPTPRPSEQAMVGMLAMLFYLMEYDPGSRDSFGRPALSQVLNCHAAVSAQLALALERIGWGSAPI